MGGYENGEWSLWDLRTSNTEKSGLSDSWIRAVSLKFPYFYSGGESGILSIWDLRMTDVMHRYEAHKGKIMCIDSNGNFYSEHQIITGGEDCKFRFFSLD